MRPFVNVLGAAALGLALLLAVLPAHAGYAEGYAAYRAGDYATALSAWRAAAKEGDARAQFGLGLMYFRGTGTEQNDRAAAKWFAAASQSRHPAALYYLGILTYNGRGVREDQFRAADLFEQSSRFGGPAAADFAMGLVFFNGAGRDQSYFLAAKWFKRAANRGHAGAQYLLGSLYRRGWGVPVDLAEAYYWMKLSERTGKVTFPPGMALRTNRPAILPDVERALKPEQIGEALDRVAAWKPAAE